jgi:hypothetical protein
MTWPQLDRVLLVDLLAWDRDDNEAIEDAMI